MVTKQFTGSPEDADLARAGSLAREIFSDVANKWAFLIVEALGDRTLRFSELRNEIEGISHKMLTQNLRMLERNGLVERTVYPDRPAAGRVHPHRAGPGPARNGRRHVRLDPPVPRSHRGRPPPLRRLTAGDSAASTGPTAMLQSRQSATDGPPIRPAKGPFVTDYPNSMISFNRVALPESRAGCDTPLPTLPRRSNVAVEHRTTCYKPDLTAPPLLPMGRMRRLRLL